MNTDQADGIDVSIVATAHRPENWLEVYKSIVANLNFELVFVGPNIPTQDLPSNFRFILSRVKPAQCVEIAIRHAQGKYIVIFADDLIFDEPYALDKLVQSWKEKGNNFAIASCRYRLNGVIQSDSTMRFIYGDDSSPVVPLAGLMLRDSLLKIGGVDRRFIGVMYDLDLAMRFYANGGFVFLNDVFVHEKFELRRNSHLYRENWEHDRKFLNSLYFRDGTVHILRSSDVLGFEEADLTRASQGPRGHWVGGGNFFIEYIQNIPYYARRTLSLTKDRELRFPRRIYRALKKLANRLPE
jgi:hypothetical protein